MVVSDISLVWTYKVVPEMSMAWTDKIGSDMSRLGLIRLCQT